MKFRLVVFLSILAALFHLTAADCQAQNFWAVPDLNSQLKEIRTARLVPPEIKVYELTAGGVPEWKDDWSAGATQNIIASAIKDLQARGIQVSQGPMPKDIETEFADVMSLYKTASSCIRTYSLGRNAFPTKAGLDYSLGPVRQVLDKTGSDALLIIIGSDQISSAGRKALMTTGLVLGVLTGLGTFQGGGSAYVEAALIGSTGKVLWYKPKVDGTSDLRDVDSSRKFIDDIFSDFPSVKR